MSETNRAQEIDMNSNYIICDGNGDAICDGISGREVERVAQQEADERGETVYYSAHVTVDLDDDDDGGSESIAVRPRYRITLHDDHEETEQFAAWLRERGHDVDVSRHDASWLRRIDGSEYVGAHDYDTESEVRNQLWGEYCGDSSARAAS